MSVLNNIDEEIEQAVTMKQLCEDLYRKELEFFKDLKYWMSDDAAINKMMTAVNHQLKEHGIITSIDYYDLGCGEPNKLILYIKVVEISTKDWLRHNLVIWRFEYAL